MCGRIIELFIQLNKIHARCSARHNPTVTSVRLHYTDGKTSYLYAKIPLITFVNNSNTLYSAGKTDVPTDTAVKIFIFREGFCVFCEGYYLTRVGKQFSPFLKAADDALTDFSKQRFPKHLDFSRISYARATQKSRNLCHVIMQYSKTSKCATNKDGTIISRFAVGSFSVAGTQSMALISHDVGSTPWSGDLHQNSKSLN